MSAAAKRCRSSFSRVSFAIAILRAALSVIVHASQLRSKVFWSCDCEAVRSVYASPTANLPSPVEPTSPPVREPAQLNFSQSLSCDNAGSNRRWLFVFNSNFLPMKEAHRSAPSSRQRFEHPHPHPQKTTLTVGPLAASVRTEASVTSGALKAKLANLTSK